MAQSKLLAGLGYLVRNMQFKKFGFFLITRHIEYTLLLEDKLYKQHFKSHIYQGFRT